MPKEWILTPTEWSLVGLSIIKDLKGNLTTDTIHTIQKETAKAAQKKLLEYLINETNKKNYPYCSLRELQSMLKQLEADNA